MLVFGSTRERVKLSVMLLWSKWLNLRSRHSFFNQSCHFKRFGEEALDDLMWLTMYWLLELVKEVI